MKLKSFPHIQQCVEKKRFQREIEISVKIPHLTRRQLVFFVFREAEKRNVFSCAFHAVERAQKNTEPLTSQLQIYRSLNICITFFEQPKPFFVGIKKKSNMLNLKNSNLVHHYELLDYAFLLGIFTTQLGLASHLNIFF